MDVQLETIMKQVADMQGLLATLAEKNGQKESKPDTDAIHKDELEKMRVSILDDMEKKIAISRIPIVTPDEEKKSAGFFSKWLLAVKRNDHEFLKGAMTEGTPAQGGYVVPTGQETEIFGALNNPATIISKCTMYPHGQMDGYTKNIPKWLTDLTVAWVDEETEKATTKPTLEQKQSILKKMFAVITFSDEFLADNISNMAQRVATLVGENFNVELERSVLAGNTDPFLGIGYVSGTNAYPQAAANLDYQDLVNIINYALIEKYHVGAELYMTRATLSLIMGLVDGSNRPLWNLQTINDKMKNFCLGVPINISSQTVSTQIIYGNFKNVLLGYKAGGVGAGIQVDVSNSATDADSVNYWTKDMTGYRFVMRRGVLVVNPEAFVKATGIA